MTFHKYPKIYRLGHDETEGALHVEDDHLVVQEKMDGANFRVYITKDGDVLFGSRRVELEHDGDHDYQGNFNRCIQYVQKQLEDTNLSPVKGCILYGECMVKHTLPYDWENVPPFLGFDIMDVESGEFLPWADAKETFAFLGLPTVPTIYEGPVVGFWGVVNEASKGSDDLNTKLEKVVPTTKWPPKAKEDMLAEGIAIKNETSNIRTKYVRDDFKEANAAVFGNTPRFNGEGYEPKLVQKFCPNRRIEKHIMSLLDEGHDLEMPLMEHLPMSVWEDIWEEEWRTIILDDASNETIDVRKARKLVTKRCVAVLKQMITNNSLQALETSND